MGNDSASAAYKAWLCLKWGLIWKSSGKKSGAKKREKLTLLRPVQSFSFTHVLVSRGANLHIVRQEPATPNLLIFSVSAPSGSVTDGWQYIIIRHLAHVSRLTEWDTIVCGFFNLTWCVFMALNVYTGYMSINALLSLGLKFIANCA